MTMSLNQALESMTVSKLQFILKIAEVPSKEHFGIKTKIMARVQQLFEQDIQQTWSLLSAFEKTAVAEAVFHTDGYIDPDYLKEKYNKDLCITYLAPGSGRYASEKDAPKIRLFIWGDNPLSDDVIRRLKAFVPEPEQSGGLIIDSASTIKEQKGIHHFNNQAFVLHDLLSVLRVIKDEPLNLTSAGVPSAVSCQKISTMFCTPDFLSKTYMKSVQKGCTKSIRGFAWIILLKIAGFVEYTDCGSIELTKAGKTLLSASSPPTLETIQKIYDCFLKNAKYDEVMRIDTISNLNKFGEWKPGGPYTTEFTDSHERRALLIKTLIGSLSGTLEENQKTYPWVTVANFSHYVQLHCPRFKVASYLGEMTLGQNKKTVARSPYRWRNLEGTYIKCFVMEYMATLGLVEIAYTIPTKEDDDNDEIGFISAYDGLKAFRLTELGVYFIGLTQQKPDMSTVKQISGKIFHITANLEVTAVVDHMLRCDQMMLDVSSDKVNEKTWRLNKKKLLNAIDDKNDFLFQFKAFLEQRTLSAMPKTVIHFFDDIEKRTSVVGYDMTAKLYTCRDKVTACLVAHDAKTRHLCRLMGDRILVVPITQDHAFKQSLKKLEYIIKKEQVIA